MSGIKIIALLSLTLVVLGCGPQRATPRAGGPDNLLRQIEGQNGAEAVRSWSFQGYAGAVIETRHYSLHTTLLDPLVVTRLAGFMEAAYQAYQQSVPGPVKPDQRMTVYLLADRGQWESFTDTFAGTDTAIYKRIRKGAYCLRQTCVAYPIGIEQTLSALGHEGWHQFTGTCFVYRLPSWLDEGMATQFENYEVRQGRFVFRPDRNAMRLGGLKMAIGRGGLIPLRTLIELNPGQVLDDDDTATAFYSQVYALTRFFQETGSWGRQYRQMLKDGMTGAWPVDSQTSRALEDRRAVVTGRMNGELSRQLFARYIPGDIDQMQGAYESFCRRIAEPVVIKTQIWPTGLKNPNR